MKQPITTVIPPGAQPQRPFMVSRHRASWHGRGMTLGNSPSSGHLPGRELRSDTGRRVA